MKNIEIMQEIGRGSFATVYKVINCKQIEAMKSIDLDQADSSITQELAILESLSHENIVKFYEVMLHETHLNIFMEYCGCSLADIIKYESLTDDQAFLILGQLIEALNYLHQSKIIHNDVKPENILMRGSVCKLSDFGVSFESMSLYNYEGTPVYSAPEAYKGEVTYNSDFYALGIIYCEMITQEAPLSNLDKIEDIFLQKQEIATIIKGLNLSRRGEEFCERCLIRREDGDELLKCKGFKQCNEQIAAQELLEIYKKVSKEKEFYSPGVSDSIFQKQLENSMQNWSFSEDIDKQSTLGLYESMIQKAFSEEGVAVGELNEQQAKNIYLKLNGLNYYCKGDELTEEEKQVLNLIDE